MLSKGPPFLCMPMRTAERFIVAFALLSLVLRFLGIKDAVPLELIGLPVLAIFYAAFTPALLRRRLVTEPPMGKGPTIALLIFNGLTLAYMLIALLRYTLNMQPALDTLENSGLLLLLNTFFALLLNRKKKIAGFFGKVMLRPALVFVVSCAVVCLPLPHLHLQGI